MRENIPGFHRARFRVIKWLGHDAVQNNALVRMLHEARDIAAAKDADLPVTERPSYAIRQKRIFARGAYGDEIAAPPAPEAQAAAPEGEAAADASVAAHVDAVEEPKPDV